MGKEIVMDTLIERHTPEIKEKVQEGADNFEFFVDNLSEREKKIFEIAYVNGYVDSSHARKIGTEVQKPLIW